MKKLLIVLMALAVASPAMAQSKLSIKGIYDATGVMADNVLEQNTGTDRGDDDKVSYFHQRFRVQPQFSPAEGIKANLRFDFAEGIWGQDQDFTSGRAGDTTTNNDNSELQVDRAFVDVNKGIFRVRAGLQFVGVGQNQVFRDNQPGLQLNIKTPVGIRMGWVKASESIGVSTAPLSDDGDANEDTDRFLVDLSYRNDAFKINAFYVMQKDGSGDTDGDMVIDNFKDEPTVAGVYVRTKVGPVALKGEFATFGGDDGNGTDYVGTQVNINGQMKFSDKLTLGMDMWYSSGADPDEKKRVTMGNPFARFDVKKGATMGWDVLTYGRNPAANSAGNKGGFLPGDIFDPFLTGTGSYGAGIGVKYIPIDPITLIGQIHYMTADSDDTGVTGEFDSGYNLLLAVAYQLAPKTSLHATYQLVEADFLDNVDVDTANVYTLRMRVAF